MKIKKPKTKKTRRVLLQLAITKKALLELEHVVEDNECSVYYRWKVNKKDESVALTPRLAPEYWFRYTTDEDAIRILKQYAKATKEVWDMRETKRAVSSKVRAPRS